MSPFIGQSLAIGLARRPATLAASHVNVAALFAAADAEPVVRVDRRSPDQRRLREYHVSRHQVPGRQQVSPEIGIVIYLPSAARGLVTRPILRLMGPVAVEFASAVAALQRGVLTAHRAHTVTRSSLHGSDRFLKLTMKSM